MSAVLEAREPSARYLDEAQPAVMRQFGLLATAAGGVVRLRQLILTLAVRGLLVPQDPGDEPASVLLQEIRAEKDRLIAEGKAKRDKSLAEITEEEAPFQLPTGWEWVRLGNVLNRLSNGYPGAQSKTPSPYPLTRIETISAATINHARVGYCSNLSLEEIEKYRLLSGDILLSHINSDIHLGKTAIVKDDKLLIHGANLLLLRPSELICAGYINLAITQRRFDGYFLSIAQHAIGQASINQSKLAVTLLALPPAAEQARIVARVDELMHLCDSLESKGRLEAERHARLLGTLLGTLTDSSTPEELAANWQRIADHFDLLFDRPEAVDALEKTILQLAVRGLLVPQDRADESGSVLLQTIRAEVERLIAQGQSKRQKSMSPIAEIEQPFTLPAGWVWVRLGEVSRVISGYAFSSQDFSSESGIRTIKITNAGVGEFYETDDYLPTSFERGFDNFKAAADDLILALTRPYVSDGLKVSRCPASYDGALINQRVAAIRCYPGMANDFAFTYMQSADVLSIYKNRFNGSGLQPNLKVSDVTELAMPLPPIAEQARIVARVTGLRRLCADLRQRLTASQTTQSHLAEALVDMAVA